MDGHRGFVSVFSSGVILIILASVFFLTPVSRGDFAGAAHGGNAGGKIIVHAAGRGDRRLSLQDGHELPGEYSGPAELVQGLRGSQVRPLSLASGDFDGDGVGDLISGYGRAGGGLVTVHRGNGQSRFPQGEAAWRQMAEGRFDEPAFLMPARVFGLPEAPDYLGVGDFNRDGRPDVVAGARGGESLYLLAGDGAGGLAPAERLALPGSVTALAVGEVNRPDGLPDVVVGLTGRAGPEVLMFQSLEGAWRSEPETVFLQAAASGLALGRLDDDEMMDVAVTAGDELVIIHGQDRTLLEVAKATSEVRHRPLAGGGPEREQMSLPFAVVSVAVGDFIWDRAERMELAVLDDEGRVHLMTRGELDRRRWSEAEMRERQEALREEARERAKGLEEAMRSGRLEEWQRGRDEEVGTMNDDVWSLVDDSSLIVHRSTQLPASLPQLRAARLGGGPTEELLVVDPAGHRVHILSLDEGQGATGAGQRAVGSLELTSAPIDVLPLQLNVDGERDLVVLRAGSAVPAVALTAAAATFMVTKTADTADGTCDVDCSLREAIIAANATPGSDMIMIPAQATPYTLTIAGTGEDAAAKGDLDITESVTLMGAGQAGTTIEAGTTTTNGIDRVFQVIGSSSVTFEGVTIRHGRVDTTGGGVDINSGTVMVSNSTVSSNGAIDGGGISNWGTLTVSNSTLTGNTAAFGGAIENFGASMVMVSNSTVSGNSSTSGLGGGMAINSGTVVVSQSTVSGNSSVAFGGGIQISSGRVTLSNSTVSGNSALALGGGIENEARLTVSQSTVSGNSASNAAGGICNSRRLTVSQSTVSGNTAHFSAGGIENFGTVALSNSTVTGNSADVRGGGIQTSSGSMLTLSNSTVAGNSAPLAGGIDNFGTATVSNSIVANGPSGGNCSNAITSLGHNIDSDGSCGFAATGDMVADPLLGPLQDNGGPTETHALLEGSPAIDAGNAAAPGSGSPACEATDQRGVSRPVDGNGDGIAVCDIGAVEAPAGAAPGAPTGRSTLASFSLMEEKGSRRGAAGAAPEPSGAQALLVAEFDQDQVRVLLGQGDGTFRRGRFLPVGDGPSAMVLGDLNRDGLSDAVIANLLSNNLSILLGQGGGTFQRQRLIPVGRKPSAVAVGDFTGDGVLDVVVANFDDDTILVLTGRGDGTFGRGRRFPVGDGPTGLAVVDLDRDGLLDLAVSNFGSNDVTLLLGGGDGRFRRSGGVFVDAGPVAIAAADFDGDGQLELVTADFTANEVTLLKAGGRRGFRVDRLLPAGDGPVTLVAGAFLTGELGLAVADLSSEGVRIYLGNGTGELTRLRRGVPGTAAATSMVAGDFNQDGRVDLAVLEADGETLRVLLDNGDGTFRRAR